jgi:LPXTG-site transpeptidase (sortase) family protein
MRHKYVLGKKPVNSVTRIAQLILICTFGLGVFGVVAPSQPTKPILRVMPVAIKQAPSESTPSDTASTASAFVQPGRPVRLQIPRMKVDAKIDALGLTNSGDMASPINIANAGWYKPGPKPGNEGSAVVAGHKTGLNGKPGIFSNLGTLKKGDNIRIIDEQNQIINFVVRETRNLNKDDETTNVFTSSSGAHLNRITCAGSWNANDKSFTQRLVVFADRIGG